MNNELFCRCQLKGKEEAWPIFCVDGGEELPYDGRGEIPFEPATELMRDSSIDESGEVVQRLRADQNNFIDHSAGRIRVHAGE